MLLSIYKDQIKYIVVDPCIHYYGKSSVPKTTFSEFINIEDLGNPPSTNHPYCTWRSIGPYSDVIKGLFLGTPTDINNEINSKLNPASPSTFKKVYFDPLCNYPRFKLSTLTNIKRCLDPSKADSIILRPREWKLYQSYTSVSSNTTNKYIVLHSISYDCYYLIDYYPEWLRDTQEWATLQRYIVQYSSDATSKLHSWASALKNSGILPLDCTIVYYGEIILMNEVEVTHITNLYSKYMLITYDTELDKFVSNLLQQPNQEDIETISRMLSSTDESVVGMGIKLLSNYDLSHSICAVGIMIIQHWDHIANSSVNKSVGFEHVLSILGLNRYDLNYNNRNKMINDLYQSSPDDQDKMLARNVVINNIKLEMQQTWERYEKRFDNLKLSYQFTIE